MAVRNHRTIARAATAACLLGAGLGMIGRSHVIAEAFGCCGHACHHFHAMAIAAYVLYLTGMALVLLLNGEMGRRFLGYGLVSLAAWGYLVLAPDVQVGRTVDPRGICSFSLLVLSVAFLAASGGVRLWQATR